MDRWSVKYSGKAVFVCVGCAGGQLATQFAKELRLKNCHITYVDQANGPRWGQLGSRHRVGTCRVFNIDSTSEAVGGS